MNSVALKSAKTNDGEDANISLLSLQSLQTLPLAIKCAEGSDLLKCILLPAPL